MVKLKIRSKIERSCLFLATKLISWVELEPSRYTGKEMGSPCLTLYLLLKKKYKFPFISQAKVKRQQTSLYPMYIYFREKIIIERLLKYYHECYIL